MGRDLRAYAAQTNRRLILGGLALAVGIAVVLIYIFFGREAATAGLLCLGLGLAPLGLIWGALAVIGWIVRRVEE